MVNNSFARFYREIYALPEARDALTHFEKRHKWYPSITLLILWHVKNHLGRLTRSQLVIIHHIIFPWHERIVRPLERLQRMMKKHKKTTKLANEIEQQLAFSQVYEINLLETHLPTFRHNHRPEKKLISDACQNILVYCKLNASQLSRNDIRQLKIILACVFNHTAEEELHGACKKHISAYHLNQPLSFEQMLLEEL